MEKNATTTERKSRVICPNTVLTTSIRIPPLTRRLMKVLSALMGVPIIHRGKSNLDEIAYYVKRAGFRSFIVILSKGDRPSCLRFYKLTSSGFFVRFGYVVLGDIIFHMRPKIFIGTNIIQDDLGEPAMRIWNFLIGVFGEDTCKGLRGSICRCIIKSTGELGVIEFWWRRKILTMNVKKVVLLREK